MPNLAARDPVLHFQRAGSGEAIVLVHGLGANLAFWFMSIGRALARDYHVICYDLRGHGASGMPDHGYLLPNMVDDLNALLDHLGIEKPHVVGHSFGARVALAHAVLRPERLCTLTIADTQAKCLQPPMRLRDWPHWPRWKRELLELGHAGLPGDDELITFELLASFNEISGGFAHGALAPGRQPRRGAPARIGAAGANAPSLRRRDMGRKGSARWSRLMNATSAKAEFADERPLTRETIATIHVPTLAMFGEFSHCLPSCRALEQLIPGTEVAIVPEAGHFHPAVKPRRFLHVLQNFLQAHPGASHGEALPAPRTGAAKAAAAAAIARRRRET